MILLWYWRHSSYCCEKFASVYDAVAYAEAADDEGYMSFDHIEVDGQIPDLTEIRRQIENDRMSDKQEYIRVDGWILEIKDTKGTKEACFLASSRYREELEAMVVDIDPSRVVIKPSSIFVRVDKLDPN